MLCGSPLRWGCLLYVMKNWLPAGQQQNRGSYNLAAKQCNGLSELAEAEMPSRKVEAMPHRHDLGSPIVEVQPQPQILF